MTTYFVPKSKTQNILSSHCYKTYFKQLEAADEVLLYYRQSISAKHGVTGDEIRLASEAAQYIKSLRLPLYWATISNPREPERTLRAWFRDFKNIIAKEQRRSGMPDCLWLEMLEGRPAVHSNILFPLGGNNTAKIAARMMASTQFPGDTLHIQPASNAQAFVAYHSKERTPQAKFIGGTRLAKRLKGSHRLGVGGGDRVRLSKALMGHLIEGGKVLPPRRIYASRALPRVAVAQPIPTPIYDFDLGLFGAELLTMPAPIKPRQPINIYYNVTGFGACQG